MIVKFHFYEGKSRISKLIKWRTRGKYSHVAVEIGDKVIEAWNGKVRLTTDKMKLHTPNTPITTICLEVSDTLGRGWESFLLDQVGKKYDFWAIMSFIGTGSRQNSKRWFCSELANTFFDYMFCEETKELISPQRLFERVCFFKKGIETITIS